MRHLNKMKEMRIMNLYDVKDGIFLVNMTGRTAPTIPSFLPIDYATSHELWREANETEQGW